MGDNDEKDYYEVRYIIIGDSAVGKTNIIYRFIKGEFNNELESTIGVDFLSKNIKKDDIILKLQLWDTNGMEKFKSIRQNYYKNAACAIIVYDITNEKSFKSINDWIEECKNNAYNENLIIILVGNKTDLSDQRKITEEEGESLGNKYNMRFYESSALTGYNINTIFNESSDMIYELIKNPKDKEYKGITKKKGIVDQIDDLNSSLEIGLNRFVDRDNNSSSCCFH